MQTIICIAFINVAEIENDIPLIDVKLLRLFEMLYTTHSVTRCADLLGQSQPTISIWLARLRTLFGDPLFVRTPAGMQPTPRADELIGTCREALVLLRRLSDIKAGFLPETARRTFKICMTDASHVTILPRLSSRIALLAPQVRLEAIRIDSTTAEQLRSGLADIAFGFLPELEAGFYQQVLYAQDWVCLVSPAHPRIHKALGSAAYHSEAHVGIAATAGHLSIDILLERAGVKRRVMLQVPGYLGLESIVSQTEMIATLPRDIGEAMARSEGLKLFKCPVQMPDFDVKLHWHARYHYDPGNRWVRQVCAELFQRASRLAPAAPQPQDR